MSKKNKRAEINRQPRRWPRRKFIRNAGAAAVAAGVAPSLIACGDDDGGADGGGGTNELKILQWNHFVPQYDTWFDPYAAAWGEREGVDVTVTHEALGKLGEIYEAERMAGEGHDLIEFISNVASLEESVDVEAMKDVNDSAEQRFGTRLQIVRDNSFNPVTDNWYAYVPGWVPDPGNFAKSLWETHASMPNGPASYDDLLNGGRMIKAATGTPIGIGLSNELDSNMATRALLWSFGASIQDASSKVAIDSAQTREAIEFMKQLVTDAMDISKVDIYNWTPGSNNQELIAGNVSYIINSISAYRTAQGSSETLAVANDTFFTRPLRTAATTGFAGPHVVYSYVIPSWSKNKAAAKDFLLSLTSDYNDAVNQSQLYNFASFPSTAPGAAGWLAKDPHGSQPDTKLEVLANASDWTRGTGQPGTANAAAAQVFNDSIIPTMFRDAVQGKKTTDQAVADAAAAIEQVYATWRTAGLVGGG